MSISSGQMICHLALKQAESSEVDGSGENKNGPCPMYTQKNINSKLLLLNIKPSAVEENQTGLCEQSTD